MPNPPLPARLVDAFRWVDVGPDSTHLVSDVSGWWRDPFVLTTVGPALADLFRDDRPTVVISPEKGGFIVGPLVASALGVGFVEAYKSTRTRQIADQLVWRSTGLDYRGREFSLGVRARYISAAERVLVVDDWADTGAQLVALRELVLDIGASYVGSAVVVNGCAERIRDQLGLRSLLRRTDLDARLP